MWTMYGERVWKAVRKSKMGVADGGMMGSKVGRRIQPLRGVGVECRSVRICWHWCVRLCSGERVRLLLEVGVARKVCWMEGMGRCG